MLQRFERGNAIEIRNGIMFNFYPGLPHIVLATNIAEDVKPFLNLLKMVGIAKVAMEYIIEAPEPVIGKATATCMCT